MNTPLLISILIVANNCYSNTNDDYNDISFLEEILTKSNKNKIYLQPLIIDLANKLNSHKKSRNLKNKSIYKINYKKNMEKYIWS